MIRFQSIFKYVSLAALLLSVTASGAPNTSNFASAPPFVATSVGKPNVVIALDISGSMKAVAYRDVGAGGWSGKKTVHDDFDPARSYYGYFESNQRYRYDTSSNKNFFVVDAAGDWDGNFLNWLTMRRMDVVRKVLVGGKVRDRAGEVIAGDTWWVIEGQNEPADRTFRKRYASSSTVSPFSDNTKIEIADGVVSAAQGGDSRQIALSANVEIGEISIDRNVADDEDLDVDSDWATVNFLNTYTRPIVVASSISYKGSDPVHVRVRNVTSTSFEVRLEEWAYRDINHTTEQVSYIVAEATDPATASSVNLIDVGGAQYEIRANFRTVSSSVTPSVTSTEFQSYTDNGYTPVVLTGVASQNNARPVITRQESVANNGFRVGLQNEESFTGGHPTSETVHWVAIQPVSGISDYSRVAVEAGTSGTVVDDSFATVNFSGGSSIFSGTPILSVGMQTLDGNNTAYARYDKVSLKSFQVKIEEEKSSDTETTHTNENVGYFAVDSVAGYKIQVGVNEEPIGVIQQNSGSMRFGLAVYNYDHNKDTTSIYNGNTVHGGTFRPCYPDISKDVLLRDNFDICYDTHVKSPLSNIVNVVEDHPLIWGTTPIAETLVEIQGYFSQTDHNRNGHTQWYDNGKEGIAGNSSFDGLPKDRNSYEVNNDWDPYYYDEYGSVLPCAQSFVLHFNDGAPYKDFDGSTPGVHPVVANDGVGPSGAQEVLDDLALVLRQNDCRPEVGMEGHQEIISYYVFAALGEDEANDNNTKKMREAAANGAFVDTDEDLAPDPSHPADFRTYIDAGGCTSNEWDDDADCNPDAFYFANDGEELVNELNAAFSDIVTRAATGGASSVIAASRSGEGSVVNAIFRPFVSSGVDEVTWIGDVHALMIDDAGNIRQDVDGDRVLDDPSVDNYLDMCTNEAESTVRARRSSSAETRPTPAQMATCSESVFSLDLFDIDYLWSGADWLADMTDVQAVTQRAYASTDPGRYIMTGIDYDNNGIIQNAEFVSFETTNFTSAYGGALTGDLPDAHTIVNYIRGQDFVGLRPRQLDGRTMRLGDVIYSTPTIVGRPNENLDLLYGSTSYRTFFNRYRHRRQVVYAGGNDGMLHAFNAGWYDAETKQFEGAQGSLAGSQTEYDLGAELWAYVPYNGLPHLEYLTRDTYGAVSSDHVYFVDLKPRIFDAKIFAPDADHPGGWGTVLVVGMRLGGGETTTDIDVGAGTDNRTFRSSIIIFDITNPDNPPDLLIEYSHPDLGFTTAIPAPITVGTDSEGNGEWYLMLGSGADTTAAGFEVVKSTQNARLFLLDLKAVAAGSATVLETSFGSGGILTLPDANSFVSDLTPVDFGLDNFTTDSVYFGTVSGDETGWGGKVYRVITQNSTGATPNAVSSWSATEMLNPASPVSSAVSFALDKFKNHWFFVGTGRYFTSVDNLDNAYHYYYGLKEPRGATGNFTLGSVDQSRIIDISSVEVEVDTGALLSAPSISPALPTNATVETLEARFRRFADPSEYLSGWQRVFRAGERNFGAATTLGGTLSYTTFDPIFDECSIEGDAYLYVVNAFTGTAGRNAIITQPDVATTNQYVINIGGSPATSPSLHKGEGYTTDKKTTAIIQTANGNIISVEQDNNDSVRDGETSWRQRR